MKKMTSGELRSMWLNFFKSKGHAVIPSASVIPENDPTVLFTTAGMHPLVPYLLGAKHPEGGGRGSVRACRRYRLRHISKGKQSRFNRCTGREPRH